MRYHRPRAPFCGIGYCTNCLARPPGGGNVRLCEIGFPTHGFPPTTNAWPSVRFDVAAVLDALFPRGIDTLHGFRRPAWATPLYQRVVRRLSGYGRPPEGVGASVSVPPAVVKDVDVTVVGAGPSGSAAADELAKRGIESVCLLDRSLSARAASPADLPGTTALFLPPPDPSAERPFTVLASRHDGRAAVVRSRRVVVATGGYDTSLLFGGNDRPGVMTADGAFAFHGAGIRPFASAVVFGGGRRALALVERFESRIFAIVSPGDVGPELVSAAASRAIPLYPRSLLLRANGRRWVRSVTIRARGNRSITHLPCDAVVLAHRRVPNPQLFFQAGARMRWSPSDAAYHPVADGAGATTVPGLYAVGEALGLTDPHAIAESGRAAAKALAASEPPAQGSDETPSESVPHPLEGYYRELLKERPSLGKWVACPCEDILLSEVEEANARGYRGIEVVKRYTGLGTGLCQGRYCLPDALLVLSILEGRAPSEVGFITQRPPVVPTPLGTLSTAADALATPEVR